MWVGKRTQPKASLQRAEERGLWTQITIQWVSGRVPAFLRKRHGAAGARGAAASVLSGAGGQGTLPGQEEDDCWAEDRLTEHHLLTLGPPDTHQGVNEGASTETGLPSWEMYKGLLFCATA